MKHNTQETLKQTSKINFKHSIGNINVLGNIFHSTYEIFLLIKGDVEFNSNKNTHKVLERELIIIPPIQYHHFIIQSHPEEYERCVLEFNDYSSSRINVKDCLNGKSILLLKEDSIIYQDFLKLIEYSKDKYSKDFEVLLTSLFEEILLNIKYSNLDEESSITTRDRLSPVAMKILDYIDNHITEPLKLEEIADELFFSVSTLCHIFKKELNMTILQYITKKRMFLAKRAIDQKIKPSIVAQQVGYSDYSTFYRNYKKAFGVSPDLGE